MELSEDFSLIPMWRFSPARSSASIASNWQRDANLVEAPSIRAALELLSDKEPTEQQGELIDGEAERQARERLGVYFPHHA